MLSAATGTARQRRARRPASQMAAAGVEHHDVARRARRAAEHRPQHARRCRPGRRRRCRRRAGGAKPSSAGSIVAVAHAGAVHLDDVGDRAGRHLVHAVAAAHQQRPLAAEHRQRPAHPLEVGRVADARAAGAGRPAGLVSGPSRLKIVRTPSARRTGTMWRNAGWWAGREHEARGRSPRGSAPRRRGRGRCARRAPPARPRCRTCEVAERLPCLATATPAPGHDEGRGRGDVEGRAARRRCRRCR